MPCGVDLVIDRLKTPKDALVLDAGAGSGNYTFEICKNVKQVVSFEVNEGMISQMTQKKERNEIQNVEIV